MRSASGIRGSHGWQILETLARRDEDGDAEARSDEQQPASRPHSRRDHRKQVTQVGPGNAWQMVILPGGKNYRLNARFIAGSFPGSYDDVVLTEVP